MRDESDDESMLTRLIDENYQLKEENRQLREDLEHLLRVANLIQREAVL